MLANVASNYLISGILPKRHGNAHANIVPYQSFQVSDGWFVVAVGNDGQFAKMCEVLDKTELASDVRFATNSARVQNRGELISILNPIFITKTVNEWLELIGDAFPCGSINTFDKVFAESQVSAREMLIEMDHPTIGRLPLVGSPLKFSNTPVDYKLPPPRLGEHTEDVLKELLGD